MSAPHDKHLWHGGFSIRSPRSVALLNPYQLPIVTSLLVVSLVFTFWPEVLEHSPLSFETLGIVHHLWHYALLLGSALTLYGMLSVRRRRLKAELIGLITLIGCLAINVTAMVADALGDAPNDASLTGLGLAVRVGILLGFLVRAYIVATEPTVDLRETTTSVGG